MQRDDENLVLNLKRGNTLEELLKEHNLYDFKSDDYVWLGNCVAYYLNKAEITFEINLNDLIKTSEGWKYWHNEIIETKIFNKIEFHKTPKGIAIKRDNDLSPNWIVRIHNIRAGQQGRPLYIYRISDSGFETIKQIEASQLAKKFWRWIDPNENMGPSYSNLFEATEFPYCSNLQPHGWV